MIEARGGGIMITLEESEPVLCLSSPEGLEVVTFEICYNQIDITMCDLYIAPDSVLSYRQSLPSITPSISLSLDQQIIAYYYSWRF